MTIANNTVLYIWKLLRMKFPSWFIYFITGGLYLLIPFTHLTSISPSSDNDQSVLWSVSLSFFNLSFKIFKFYLFTFGCAESSLLHMGFLWLQQVGLLFVSVHRVSSWWLVLLRGGSVVVVHELRCLLTCGIFLDQGLNPCLLQWQVDS